MPTFGERLRRLRKGAGLTGTQLGDAAGVGHSQVSAWENDRAWPNGAQLVAMGALLNVNLHWLLTGEGPRHPPDAAEDLARLTEVLSRFRDGMRILDELGLLPPPDRDGD